MRSMMLTAIFFCGCACYKKHEPPTFMPVPEQIIIREYPPFPPDLQPQPQPQPKVKVTDVIPLLPEPPIVVPEFNEPQIKFPQSGQPYLIKDKKAKIYLIENPPYNGPPNVGCEIIFNW
jgi:hypothetical protein